MEGRGRKATKKRGAMELLIAGALFAVTWVLWSGHGSPLLLSLGALSCAIVLLLAARTGFFEMEVYALHLAPRLPPFWVWLLKEIVVSNVKMARIVLSRRMPIAPTIVTVDTSHLPVVSQATLANAITLTPGTLSLDVNRGMIEVHCLTHESAEELRAGEMLRRASQLGG